MNSLLSPAPGEAQTYKPRTIMCFGETRVFGAWSFLAITQKSPPTVLLGSCSDTHILIEVSTVNKNSS